MFFDFGTDSLLDAAAALDRGPYRGHMEDAAVLAGRRFAVCDGLGGMGGGDKAALAAARKFGESTLTTLEDMIREAHDAVLKEQGWHECMTTIATAHLLDQSYKSWSAQNGLGRKPTVESKLLKVAWSGDSRVYVLRSNGDLEQITQDHGSEDVVGRCLGSRGRWFPDATETKFGLKDILLISSDGLHGAVPHQYIADQLRCGGSAQEIAHRLVQLALNHGTRDNVTALVAKFR